MSDVSAELLIKELSARFDALETQQKAMNAIVSTLATTLPREQKNLLKQALKEKFDLAINHGAPGLKPSFESQKKAVESVVGSLG